MPLSGLPPKTRTFLLAVDAVLGRLALGLAIIFIVYGFIITNGRTDDLKVQSDRIEAQANAIQEQGRLFFEQNVRARYDDCINGNEIRAALLARTLEAQRTNRILFRLVPSLDNPEVHTIIRKNLARDVAAYAQKNCREYALQAVPPSDRERYGKDLPERQPKPPQP